jgi:hypothetical protein
MAVVLGTALLVQFPADGGRPAARLAVGTPSATITLGRYLTSDRKAGASPFTSIRALGQSGRTVSYAIDDVVNLANLRCELRWAELAQQDLRPATEGNWRYEDVLGWPDGLLYPIATTRAASGELWIPEPNPLVDTGYFFMRLRLLCDGREIARRDTAPFLVDLSPLPPSVAQGAATPSGRPRTISASVPEQSPVGESP